MPVAAVAMPSAAEPTVPFGAPPATRPAPGRPETPSIWDKKSSITIPQRPLGKQAAARVLRGPDGKVYPIVDDSFAANAEKILRTATLGAILLTPATAHGMDFSVVAEPATWLVAGGAVLASHLALGAIRRFLPGRTAAASEPVQGTVDRNEVAAAVKQTIALAKNSTYHNTHNDILLKFTKQYAPHLMCREALLLAKATTYNDTHSEILKIFYHANFKRLTVDEIISLAKSSPCRESHDDILWHAAQNREDFLADQLNALAVATVYNDTHNKILQIAANAVNRRPIVRPAPVVAEPVGPSIDELYDIKLKDLPDDIKRDTLVAIAKKIWAVAGSDARRTHFTAMTEEPLASLGETHYREPVVLEIAARLADTAKEIRDDAAWVLDRIAVKIALTPQEFKNVAAVAERAQASQNADIAADAARFLGAWRKRAAAREKAAAGKTDTAVLAAAARAGETIKSR